MNEKTYTENHRAWPIGAHLRFKRDAAVLPKYRYLRGTPVLVLGVPTIGLGNLSRQSVFAYSGRTVRHRNGCALPAQLEPIPDESGHKQSQMRESVDA